jgi:hypothetical protein
MDIKKKPWWRMVEQGWAERGNMSVHFGRYTQVAMHLA